MSICPFFFPPFPSILGCALIFQKELLIWNDHTNGFESFSLGKSGKHKYSICHSHGVA